MEKNIMLDGIVIAQGTFSSSRCSACGKLLMGLPRAGLTMEEIVFNHDPRIDEMSEKESFELKELMLHGSTCDGILVKSKKCDYCDVHIRKLVTEAGRFMPVEAWAWNGQPRWFYGDGNVVHFGRCPGYQSKKKGKGVHAGK